MARGPLLLVGFRRGVLPALRRLGLPVRVLVPRGSAASVPDEVGPACEVDLHGPGDAIETAAREFCGGATPSAVVALAERTVLVAARLREVFGLGGNGIDVALACADKLVMKQRARSAGVRVTDWREVDASTDAATLARALGLPLVLKPRRDSGGRGQSVVRTAEELPAALAALDAQTAWIAEAWIEGVESSVECFVRDGRVLFTNTTEYLVPRHANVLPSALSPDELQRVRSFAARAIHALGVRRGITHMEVFRTADGLVFGELAIRPPGGRLMPLLKDAWGFDPWEALLRLELGDDAEFPKAPRRVAGVYILHPGCGRVRRVEGIAAAEAIPGVTNVTVRVEPGDVVGERVGSGQDIGVIRARGADRDAVAEALLGARAALVVDLEPI